MNKILELGRLVDYQEGDALIRFGELTDGLYLLVDGLVDVISGQTQEPFATSGPFEFIGESSAIKKIQKQPQSGAGATWTEVHIPFMRRYLLKEELPSAAPAARL